MPYTFANGTGTEADPYQVATATDLAGVNDYLSAYFIQTANIDMSEVEWTSIGSSAFTGNYNGDGYKITNITSALFNTTRLATLTNIGLEDVNIIDEGYGVLVNSVLGGTFEGCYSTGTISSATNGILGGLIGHIQGWFLNGEPVLPEINNCYSTCTVSSTGESISISDMRSGIGGLIGVAGYTFDSPNMENCYSCGAVSKVSTDPDVHLGGLVGYILNSGGTIADCFYDSTTSGCSDTDKGTPKTTLEMKTQSTYTDWDFDTVWGIDPAINDGYPYLLVFSQAAPEEPIIDDVIPSYPPASYIKLQFQAGDSELYDMGIFYTDKTRYRVGDPGAKVNARNSVGKYLRDQTYDERNNYSPMRLDDLLKKILTGAGITDFYVAPNSTQIGMQFAPNRLILDGINDVLAYAPGWIIREEVTGKVVIGPKDDAAFTQPSRYTFQRDRDIFSREQIKDDQLIYGRVCVHVADFSIKVYRAVTSALGWLPPAQKTYYQVVPDGTTSQEAAALATELADAMADSGEVETFVCPFRPQIIPGDEAEILDSDGATFLGVITQVTHSFGAQGFFSEIVVDSGGRIGRPRFKDLVNAINSVTTISHKF